MQFQNLDFNNIILLAIAMIGLFNTILTMVGNKTNKDTNTLTRDTNSVAVETRDIAQQTQIDTRKIAVKVKNGGKRMTALFDDATTSMRKGRHK